MIRWPIAVIVILIVALVAYRYPTVKSEMKTAEAVAAIHAQRLTLSDVDGSNLPPTPDPMLVDATIEGVDANDNGIRDDVELAIYKKYPNNQKVRAAELQYAMNLQSQLTTVWNSDTLVAAIQNEERAYFCIQDTGAFKSVRPQADRLEAMMLNTESRKAKYKQIYQDYMTSYGSLDSVQNCDV